MNSLFKALGSILRSLGFVVFPLALFYFFAVAFTGGLKESGYAGPIALAGLAAIGVGDWLRKRAGLMEPIAPGSTEDQVKASYTNIIGAVIFSAMPGASQAFNGQYAKATLFTFVSLAAPLCAVPFVYHTNPVAAEQDVTQMTRNLLLIILPGAVLLIGAVEGIMTAVRFRKFPAEQRRGGWNKGFLYIVLVAALIVGRNHLFRHFYPDFDAKRNQILTTNSSTSNPNR